MSLEMPEGYKRIKLATRNALEMSKATEGKTAIEFVLMAEDLNNVSIIMKEMAEALGHVQKCLESQPNKEKLGYADVASALKKFKEWK